MEKKEGKEKEEKKKLAVEGAEKENGRIGERAVEQGSKPVNKEKEKKMEGKKVGKLKKVKKGKKKGDKDLLDSHKPWAKKHACLWRKILWSNRPKIKKDLLLSSWKYKVRFSTKYARRMGTKKMPCGDGRERRKTKSKSNRK